MNVRERLRCMFSHAKPDRLPMIEWASWWDETLDRWRAEGLPPELDKFEIREYFGQDPWMQFWIPTLAKTAPEPSFHGAALITDFEEYNRFKQYLYPQVDLSPFKACLQKHESGELVVWVTLEGFFWFPRKLLGIENHLISFYEQPELYRAICEDYARWLDYATESILSVLTPDFVVLSEDMSYNKGPMIGRALFDEFLRPLTVKLVRALKSAGVPVILDSDGNITDCLGWYLEAGVDGALPLERQAGVDVEQLQSLYPQAVLIGAYDKMVMPHGEEAIKREFERLLPAMRHGGFIPSVDHQTPPGVSLEQYSSYMRMLKEYSISYSQPSS